MPDTSLTLISHALCPFVQRAAIVLLEKGVSFERINVDLSNKPQWFLDISPTGKVPVLRVHQEGAVDGIIFESMVICEYLEETQGGALMYPTDALARAQHRAWIEFATTAMADAWQFLNATDAGVAQAKQLAFREKLQRVEQVLGDGPYFGGADFGMVDAVFAPLFRYFGIISEDASAPIFDGLPRISAWREALSSRPSVINAVGANYADLFGQHLHARSALLAR